jgi:hypothetical protein
MFEVKEAGRGKSSLFQVFLLTVRVHVCMCVCLYVCMCVCVCVNVSACVMCCGGDRRDFAHAFSRTGARRRHSGPLARRF